MIFEVSNQENLLQVGRKYRVFMEYIIQEKELTCLHYARERIDLVYIMQEKGLTFLNHARERTLFTSFKRKN